MKYDELLRRLQGHRALLREQGLAVDNSRFGDLCNAVEFTRETFEKGQVRELVDSEINQHLVWGLTEAVELEGILRNLTGLAPDGFIPTLRFALEGQGRLEVPLTPAGETPSETNRARNAMFELLIGAHLAQELTPLSFVEPDIHGTLLARPTYVACKRPFSAKSVEDRCDDAARQIARHRKHATDIGIVALAADRVVNPDPGRQFVALPSHEATRAALVRAIDRIIPRVEGALGPHSQAVNLAIIQVAVPAVIPNEGLQRVSETTILQLSPVPGASSGELARCISACFESL